MNRMFSFRLALVVLAAIACVGAFWLPTGTTGATGLSITLVCEPAGSGAFCVATPFSTDYTYAWSATGSLTLGSGGPTNQVGCLGETGGGTVTVTVTAPGIGSDTDSRSISCSGPGTGPPWSPPGGF